MKKTNTTSFSYFVMILSSFLLISGVIVSSCKNKGKNKLAQAMGPALLPVDTLLTCQICGYRSLPVDTASCPVCFVQLSPSEVIAWGYRSLEEMIREEQAMFFAAEGFREKDFFTQPLLWEAEGALYRKDTTWSPVITEAHVLSMRDTLMRAGVIE